MKKLNLEIEINASNEKVWASIVDVNLYRIWAEEFMEGSYFEGGWKKGDAIQFLAENESGNKEGMVSEIAESDYPKYISIRHLGYIMDGVIDTTSDLVKAWAPSYENYTLEALGDHKTKFKLDMDVEDQYYDMMLEMWQRAMQQLKQVSER
ncbi:MAG TPA: SRPBCC domain-containing protein [Fusibacter sp.]|nr:SRPBCC domain-containing protein [Fusibacter sp.]